MCSSFLFWQWSEKIGPGGAMVSGTRSQPEAPSPKPKAEERSAAGGPAISRCWWSPAAPEPCLSESGEPSPRKAEAFPGFNMGSFTERPRTSEGPAENLGKIFPNGSY